ncbi:helix-turn-helix domain-containing protein [Agrococcus sp. KRD186]|uniref:helix-turn-helix domain-containing protein n=1 Tax=Agrococcus sp. KRD186 TaxID=2729730 RepID=UPI0019D0CE9D|nr:helix-turn-helix domain-containing protein [Agrococcus sp. KRD186]
MNKPPDVLDPLTDLRAIAGAYLTQEDIASICRVAVGTVRNWRSLGIGPAYARMKPPLYRARDVADWIDAGRTNA